MKKLLTLLGLIIISFTLFFCSKNSTSPDDNTFKRELTSVEKSIVEADNKFGLKIFREIINEEQNKNVFISPLSISMALGMTMNGADGATKTAMQNTLEFQGITETDINKSYQSLIELLVNLDSKVKFQIANSIWYRSGYSFEQSFFDVNSQYFDAVIQGLDFGQASSVNIINSWVEDKTYGKIKTIIEEIDPATVMFLINAIYFKGTWTYQFDENLTHDTMFNLLDNSQKECKMMTQHGVFPYFENEMFQAVDLPYGDSLFSMMIIMPKRQEDIDAVIGEMTSANWNNWLTQLNTTEGDVSLPRFKLEYEFKLNDVLSALGMEVAFTGAADFTRMRKSGGLYISEVRHKSFVEVNEEGTEAAAVTIVDIRETSIGSDFNMRMDRPFLFAIKDNHSQTILFIGKIVDPT